MPRVRGGGGLTRPAGGTAAGESEPPTAILTAGAGLLPYMLEESLVGFLEQSSRFLKPVFANDTIYPALEIVELTPGRTTGVLGLASTVHNQRRELLLEGTQRYLIKRRST